MTKNNVRYYYAYHFIKCIHFRIEFFSHQQYIYFSFDSSRLFLKLVLKLSAWPTCSCNIFIFKLSIYDSYWRINGQKYWNIFQNLDLVRNYKSFLKLSFRQNLHWTNYFVFRWDTLVFHPGIGTEQGHEPGGAMRFIRCMSGAGARKFIVLRYHYFKYVITIISQFIVI